MAIPIFYINMDVDVCRREHTENTFGNMGITPTRVAAVDGNQLSDADFSAYTKRVTYTPEPMTKPEMGCFLSHIKAWRMFLQTNSDWAFITEDDVYYADDFADFITNTDWIPIDATVVKAETAFDKCVVSCSHHEQFALLPSRGGGKHKNRTMRRLLSFHFCAGGYFINRAAAIYGLALSKTMISPMDVFLFFHVPFACPFMHNQIIYQIDPAICVQGIRIVYNNDLNLNLYHGTHDFHNTSGLEPERILARKQRQMLRPAPHWLAKLQQEWRNCCSSYYKRRHLFSLTRKAIYTRIPYVQ